MDWDVDAFVADIMSDGSSAAEAAAMTIAKTITEYRDTKQAMQAIIDRHMQAAFEEIKREFGDTPTGVDIRTLESQELSKQYPAGIYAGCSVELGGE
ncbi:hypothetical protein [Stutzerimonas kunmingensis]|uniref:hypothetical protein n=1 Tax=Stutzerimonas kunmingensis TaxID=1211807 RepID=UPI0028B1CE4A|nr:hypothetical protein [Stutzerimonas kunmingensis]